MTTKQIKLKTHTKLYYEGDLIVNIDALSKGQFQLQIGDIIEISYGAQNQQNENKTCLILQIETVPQEFQSKGGPLSISKELAQSFNLDSVREVCVRRVEREEVGVDLVEMRFKDQCLTRSDMWRFTSSMASKFVHVSKKLEHSGIRAQVSKLWSTDGSVVSSGAIVNKTRVVFRSASVQMFLFIQISTEMWEFDQSGDLYFDKAVSGFLKELFQRWKDESCNHEVTLVFFWRTFYTQSTLDSLSQSVRLSVQKDKTGRSYEDFYTVIAAGESLTDWNSKLVDIKKTFACLKESLTRARGKDVKISIAAEGNVLEAINMAVNVFQKHYVDCNFSMTGQQVVIVTAGVGVFEVDHELTRLTKERIIDGGVGADLVCLTEQPLHAVPLFRFQNMDGMDNSDYYHIPHWINYSFYSPPNVRNRFQFQPRLQLSDHLVNDHLNRGKERSKGLKLYNPFSVTNHPQTSILDDSSKKAFEDRLLNRVDYDTYDASIFSKTDPQGVKTIFSMSKVQSSNILHSGNSSVRTLSAKTLVRHHSNDESSLPQESPGGVLFLTEGKSFEEEDPFDVPRQLPVGMGLSPGSKSTGAVRVDSRMSSKEGIFTTSLHPGSYRSRVHSEHGDASVTSGFTAGSAESLRQFYFPKPSLKLKGDADLTIISRKKRTFINPFDPARLHADLTAYHRRWMHVFPRNKSGMAFQVHHMIQEDPHGESCDSLQSSSEQGISPPDHTHKDELSNRSSGGSLKGHDGSTVKDQNVPSNLASSSGLWMKKVPDQEKSALRIQEDHYSEPTNHVGGRVRTKQLNKSNFSGDSVDSMGSPCLNKRTQVFTVGSVFSPNNEQTNENFACARRLGTDWPSLTEPACLPVTTDFFPSVEKLASEFGEHPSKLVASTFSYGSGESSGKKTTPAWITDHQDVSTFQVYSEMISQRLSQGFQLVFEPKSGGKETQDTIFSLHKHLTELNEEVTSKPTGGIKKKKKKRRDLSVKLSLGRVFQKIELNYPDLVIWIYRPKDRESTNPISSTYQLSTAVATPTSRDNDIHSQRSEFTTCRAEFCHTRVEDYNWNYLDQHVCGYSDFEELGESQKYWRCRYLLLPATPVGSEGSEVREGREDALIASFVNFLEVLNHVKRGGPGSKTGSKQNSLLPSPAYKRQASLPVSTTSSRSHTPNETHSNVSSPFVSRPSRKLAEIDEEKPRPNTPLRSESSPHHHTAKSSRRGSEDGLRISEFTKTRPMSPYMASSQPKQGEIKKMSEKDGLKKDADFTIKRAKTTRHRRTGSHDYNVRSARSRDDLSLDDHKLPMSLKTKGSPQLLRRTAGDGHVRTGTKQDQSFGSSSKKGSSSANSSPTHTPKHSRVGGAKKSSDTPLPVEVTPPTPSEDGARDVTMDTMSRTSPESSFCGVNYLSSSCPRQFIAEALASVEDGIDFLGQLPGLRSSCFVAMEAVSWVMEQVSGVDTRKDAVKILQDMVSEQLVIHASGDFSIPFVDGYFLYYLPYRDSLTQEGTNMEQLKDNVDRSFIVVEEMDFEKFSKRWFEVKIHQTSSFTNKTEDQTTLATFGPSPSSMSPFAASFQKSGSAYYMHFEGKEDHYTIPTSMLNRYVELNPDPQGRSDRPEWCYVRYDHVYRPKCAFQLEFQWMVTTMNLLNQLIQSWLSKATRCGFNLVPVPMLQALSKDRCVSAHPFREQHFIPLQLPASFPGWCESEPVFGLSFNNALYKLFDAIIDKFGFLLDPASLPQQSDVLSPNYDAGEGPSFTSRFFIHHTGAALVQPSCETNSNKGAPPQACVGTDDKSYVVHSVAMDIKGGGQEEGRGSTHSGQFSIPIGSSTPVMSSPSDGLWIPPDIRGRVSSDISGRGLMDDVKCGFYWYKNHLFLRQKNTSATFLDEYNKLLSQLTGFCRDENNALSDLCSAVFYEERS